MEVISFEQEERSVAFKIVKSQQIFSVFFIETEKKYSGQSALLEIYQLFLL